MAVEAKPVRKSIVICCQWNNAWCLPAGYDMSFWWKAMRENLLFREKTVSLEVFKQYRFKRYVLVVPLNIESGA